MVTHKFSSFATILHCQRKVETIMFLLVLVAVAKQNWWFVLKLIKQRPTKTAFQGFMNSHQ